MANWKPLKPQFAILLPLFLLLVRLNIAADTITSTSSNTSNTTTAPIQQHLSLPVSSGIFDTRYFIEYLSWQPLSLDDVIGQATISQLEPWLWRGVKGRSYDTVTSFSVVHCCRKHDDGTRTQNCFLPAPPHHRDGAGDGAGDGADERSLWMVLSDHQAMDGCVAMVPLTHTIGKALKTPNFLRDFDLALLDWQYSGLVYIVPDVTVSASPPPLSTTAPPPPPPPTAPALFLCPLEGSGHVTLSRKQSLTLTGGAVSPILYEGEYRPGECIYSPTGWSVSIEAATLTTALLLTWPDDVIISEDYLQHLDNTMGGTPNTEGGTQNTDGGTPNADRGTLNTGGTVAESSETYQKRSSDEMYQEHSSDGTYQERSSDGTYQGRSSDQTFQEHTEDETYQGRSSDQTYQEHTEDETYQKHSSDGMYQKRTSDANPQEHTSDTTYQERSWDGTYLSSFLPVDDTEENQLKKLWVKPAVLPHVVQYYYLAKHAPFSQQQFLKKVKPDSLLLPNLVDCSAPSECHHLLLALLRVLDLDGDGQLGPRDLDSMTSRGLPALQLEVDDLVQEIRDLALDQWYEAMEGSPSEWALFAERASASKAESARAVARRIQDGELSAEELSVLKDSLPDLYQDLKDLNEREDEALKFRDEF